jgi:hypothetical protein
LQIYTDIDNHDDVIIIEACNDFKKRIERKQISFKALNGVQSVSSLATIPGINGNIKHIFYRFNSNILLFEKEQAHHFNISPLTQILYCYYLFKHSSKGLLSEEELNYSIQPHIEKYWNIQTARIVVATIQEINNTIDKYSVEVNDRIRSTVQMLKDYSLVLESGEPDSVNLVFEYVVKSKQTVCYIPPMIFAWHMYYPQICLENVLRLLIMCSEFTKNPEYYLKNIAELSELSQKTMKQSQEINELDSNKKRVYN